MILVTAPRGLGVRAGRPWLSEKAHARPGRGFLFSDNLGGASVGGAGPSCFPQALPRGAGGGGPKEGPEEGAGERRNGPPQWSAGAAVYVGVISKETLLS